MEIYLLLSNLHSDEEATTTTLGEDAPFPAAAGLWLGAKSWHKTPFLTRALASHVQL